MSTTIRDWSAWPFTLAAWNWDPSGKPTMWKVLTPGSAGSLEEAQAYEGWLANPPGTNDEAFASGRPLPFPEQATPLQRRPYDRERWHHGMLLTDRRQAAILAPGEFPDVDTSVDPPQFYATREAPAPTVGNGGPSFPTVPTLPPLDPAPDPDPTVSTSNGNGLNVALAGTLNDFTPPRAPVIGEQVIVHLGDGHYDAAEVMGLARTAYGTVADIVYVRTGERGYRWAPVVAWVEQG